MLAPSKKGLGSPFSLIQKRIYLSIHLKEELTDLFEKVVKVFSILTGRVERAWRSLC